jgi:hypothetical protein
MSDTPPPQVPRAWARPWAVARPFARPTPRAGAWYPVIGDAGDRVVLEIRGRRVAVAARLLVLRTERPTRFTVVVLPRDADRPTRGTAADLGTTYGVCPMCGARLLLAGTPSVASCRGCGHRGEVAWWETG